MKNLVLMAVTAATLLLPTSAQTGDANNPYSLALSIGTFGVLDTEELVEVDLELRMPKMSYDLRPIIGVSMLNDGGNYVYSGMRYDLGVTDNWTVSPSFAVGLYSPGHVDLGGPIEFRSALDISYRLTGESQIGFGLSHLSNGGIYSRNGGSESLVVTYTLDL